MFIKIVKSIKSLSLVGAAVLGLSIAGVADASTVTVQSGDTVSAIAQANGTTVSQIEKDNNLSNVNLIFVGDKLQVNTPAVKEGASEVPAKVSQPAKAQTQVSNQGAITQASTTSTSNTVNTSSSTEVTNSGTLSDSEAQAVAEQMAQRTGQSASYWRAIMWRESNNQVHAANPQSTARGLFQQLHGGEGTVQQQIDNAVELYSVQGTQAWAL